MRIVGYISKHMYHVKNTTLIGIDLKHYKIPLDEITDYDIGRKVMLDDDNNIVLESYKDKKQRLKSIYIAEKEDNKPIINLEMETRT